MSGLRALRSFARGSGPPAPEHCDLCGVVLASEHPHLLARAEERVVCSCRACALLFMGEGQIYRRIEPRARALDPELISDEAWSSLDLPIGLAYFVRPSVREATDEGPSAGGVVVARYPGAAGAVEAALPAGLWERVCADAPEAALDTPDVEAILVSRLPGRRACWRLSIDHCFRLVGSIRARWRGLSGGDEVRRAIEAFFESLPTHAAPAAP